MVSSAQVCFRGVSKRAESSMELGVLVGEVSLQPVPPTWDGVIHVLPLAPVVTQPVP